MPFCMYVWMCVHVCVCIVCINDSKIIKGSVFEMEFKVFKIPILRLIKYKDYKIKEYMNGIPHFSNQKNCG